MHATCKLRAPDVTHSDPAGVGGARSWASRARSASPAPGCTGLVLTTRRGTPIEPRNLNRHFYPIRERLGLDVRFRGLRHTCVTLLLGIGVPPHIVRDIVGHSALDVTMNIYAHADMTEKRAALDRLGSLLADE
ncbi:tyrosine-type recombinase/integrase [Streptomyces actuosus]|uniref:tyrosine-type recombinase/integrase n=1 Tax=Streptomyces actuosus TaxID=1885 RepID=UPI0027DA5B43|nr:tyrosine-type recombinase/integrase [Streptomyces actuosus]